MPITYTIEPHEITELTWPMWEACSIECPAMIGGTCPKREQDRTGVWRSCPGWSAQYTNAAAEVIHGWTMESGQDDECGDASERDAWFALFKVPKTPQHPTLDGPMGAGVILCVTSQGFVSATRFATPEELTRDWEKITAEYDDDDDDDENLETTQ